jgi:hypothetical protein
VDQRSQKTDGVTTQGSIAGAVRARYREGQVLRAADLAAEQAYLIAMRRRHNIGGHVWGIVRGLELKRPRNKEEITLQPGMAVDGFGRELIIQEAWASSFQLLNERFEAIGNPKQADFWLCHARQSEFTLQPGKWDCGPGQNNRWREEVVLLLTEGDSDSLPDPRKPVSVAEEDFDFSPHEIPPDDPDRKWPVYLGRVTRTTSTTSSGDTIVSYEVVLASIPFRPYATLIGESVTAPSGRAMVQVGAGMTGDLNIFSVKLRRSTGELADNVAVDRAGNAVTVRGNATLSKTNSNLHPGEEICFEPLAEEPQAAAPWRIYRVKRSKDGAADQQLRIEIAHPGKKDDPRLYQFAVGMAAPDKNNEPRFNSCLLLQSDCTVTIKANNFTVHGRLIQGPIRPDPDDPRFADEILKQWNKSLLNNVDNLAKKIFQVDSGLVGRLEITDFKATDVVAGTKFKGSFSVLNPGINDIVGIVPIVRMSAVDADGKEQEITAIPSPSVFSLQVGKTQRVDVISNTIPITAIGLKIVAAVEGRGPVNNPVVDLITLELPVQASSIS